MANLKALRLAQNVIKRRTHIAQETSLITQRTLYLANQLPRQVFGQLLHSRTGVIHKVINILQITTFQARA